jgi:hypothetical protein
MVVLNLSLFYAGGLQRFGYVHRDKNGRRISRIGEETFFLRHGLLLREGSLRRLRCLEVPHLVFQVILQSLSQGESIMMQSNRRRGMALWVLVLVFLTTVGCKGVGGEGAAQSGAGISGPLAMLPDYQARAPRTCAAVKSPPSVAQATVMVQCSMDALSDTGLGLIQDVKLQMASSRPFAFWTDAGLADVDQKADVYPLQGSYTGYFCRLANTAPAGQSCLKSAVPVAQGWCWKTSAGEWKCKMQGGAPTTVNAAAPTTF